ncbi:conserved Plasmodium protein, unknown function [Plasmodium gallinaceum]|uniref:Lipoprotein n=1 Tax=Plasmodium gallinaceum TaxID=5849 RepID=A0A1J1GME0_PLAGA|nr:conserved Plasmodium protein, unknown function [Plasmodium gallinaceum]CRG93499.1 conserved Plasmodium protein, unknown function [Plasmodium gallinaceum]
MKYPFFFVLLFIYLFSYFCNCEKVKKNKNLRNLLKSLTNRVDTDDGKNEYSRLTQSPKIEMKLSKANFKTTLQNILIQSYSENVKELISKTNYEIQKEKSLLDEINNSNFNLNKIADILSGSTNIKRSNKLRNKYSHYLGDNDLGLIFLPIYKTFKSNSSHFNNNLYSSLLPHELLEKGYLSNEQILRNSQKKLLFPERGDITLEI